jgi:hypothetical protein
MRGSGRRLPSARSCVVIAVLAVASGLLATAGCSVLLDWNGYTGGSAPGVDGGNYLLTCGTHQVCAPVPPTGWTGPVAFAEVASDAGAPTCSGSYMPTFQGSAGLDVPPPVCNCTCSPPTGQTCPLPQVSFFSDSNCATPCGTPAMLSNSTCPTVPSGCTSEEVAAVTPQGGSCSPNFSETLPGTTWARESTACVPSGDVSQGSCSAGNFCLPSPPSSFTFCVSQPGIASWCPDGSTYSQGPFHEYADRTLTEGRGCTNCSCGDPADASCDQVPGFLYITNCTIPTIPFATPLACTPMAGSGNGLPRATALPAGSAHAGQCAPMGGVPQGSATPNGTATSFCCAL